MVLQNPEIPEIPQSPEVPLDPHIERTQQQERAPYLDVESVNQERETLRARLQDSQANIQTAAQTHQQLTAGRRGESPLNPLGLPSALSLIARGTGASEEEVEQSRQHLIAMVTDQEKYLWRSDILDHISSPIDGLFWRDGVLSNPEEIVSIYAERANSEYHPDAEDVEWLERQFAAITGYVEPQVQSLTATRDFFLKRQTGQFVSINNLAVEEIIKNYVIGNKREITGEEIEQHDQNLLQFMIANLEVSEREALEEFTNAKLEASRELNSRQAAYRLDVLNPEIPDFTWTQILTAPVIPLLELLNTYHEKVVRPLSAATVVGTSYLPWSAALDKGGFDDLKRKIDERRDRGESTWTAWGNAFEEWDQPWGIKFAYEIAADPLTYIGVGYVTKPLSELPVVLRPLAAFNNGLARFGDETVGALFKLPARVFPQTVTQKASNLGARQARSLINLALKNGRLQTQELRTAAGAIKLEKYLRESVRATLGKAPKLTKGGAYEARDVIVNLSELKTATPQDMLLLARELNDAGGSSNIRFLQDITASTWESFDGEWSKYLATGRQVKLDPSIPAADKDAALAMMTKEYADRLVTLLTQNSALKNREQLLDIAQEWLESRLTRLERSLENLVAANPGETGHEYMLRLGRNIAAQGVEAARIGTRDLGTGSFLGYKYQRGLMSSILAKLDIPIRLGWINLVERYTIQPFSQGYLTFSAYGPFNIAEGVLKSTFAGISPLSPLSLSLGFFGSRVSPKFQLLSLYKGLDNLLTDEFYGPSLANWREILSNPDKVWTEQTGIVDKGTLVREVFTLDWISRIPLVPDWFSPYKLFVRLPGLISQEQRAHYVSQQFKRYLLQNNPVEAEYFEYLVNKHYGIISDLPKSLRDQIRARVENNILVDSDELLQVVPQMLSEVNLAEIDRIAVRHPDLPWGISQRLKNDIQDGNYATGGVSAYTDDVISAFDAEHILAPDTIAQKWVSWEEQMNSFQPQTYDELVRKMREIHVAQEAFQDYTVYSDENIKVLANKVEPKNRDAYYEASVQAKRRLERQVEKSINRVLEQVRLGQSRLSQDNIDEVIKLFSVTRGNTSTAKRKQIAQVILDLPIAVRQVLFHENFAQKVKFTTNNPTEIRRQAVQQYIKRSISIGDTAQIEEYLKTTGRYRDAVLFQSALSDVPALSIGDRQLSKAIDTLIETNSDFRRVVTDIEVEFVAVTSGREVTEKFTKAFNEVWPRDASEYVVNDFENLSETARTYAVKEEATGTGPVVRTTADEANRLFEYIDTRQQSFNLYIDMRKQLEPHYRLISQTPKAKRTAAFWQSWFAERDRIAKEMRDSYNRLAEFEDLNLRRVYQQRQAPPRIDLEAMRAQNRNLAVSDVMKLLGTDRAELNKSIIYDLHSWVDRDSYVSRVRGRANEMLASHYNGSEELLEEFFSHEAVGRIYDDLVNQQILFKPEVTATSPLERQHQIIKNFMLEVAQSQRLVGPRESYLKVANEFVQAIHAEASSNPRLQDLGWKVQEGVDSQWTTKRAEAGNWAEEQYSHDFAVYDRPNAVNGFMKTLFPFWTYEAHRYHWLLREAIRHPGTISAWGKYMNYSDRGYMNIPGLDKYDFNPLRGTIAMGGYTSLLRLNYPSYEDNFPGFSEGLDMMGRFGFYPNVLLMGLGNFFGPKSLTRQSSWTNIIPGTLLNFVYGVESLNAPALNRFSQAIFPDHYRNYYVMREMAKRVEEDREKYNPEGNPRLAQDIYFKVQAGEELTPEEHELYNDSYSATARDLLFIGQMGVLRLRPDKLEEALVEVEEIIEELTGVTREEQQLLRRRGYTYNDYIRKYVTPEERQLLNQLDAFVIWAGASAALTPSSEAEEQRIVSDFWRDIEQVNQGIKANGIVNPHNGEIVSRSFNEVDERFKESGNGANWVQEMKEIIQTKAGFVEVLSSIEKYSTVPITEDEQRAYWEEHGVAPLQLSPEEQIINYIHSIELVEKEGYNPVTGTFERYLDWDSYWGQIYLTLEIVRTHDPFQAEEITRHLDRDYTDLGKFHREYRRNWQNIYRSLNDLVLEDYTEEERLLIRGYETAPVDRQEELRARTRADGSLVIASYEKAVRGARDVFRRSHPEVEATMVFFGDVQSFSTDRAELEFSKLKQRFGIRQ